MPFSIPEKPLRGKERMTKVERALSAAQVEATKSIGIIISLGEMYMRPESQDYIYGDLAEWILAIIGESMTREALNYAELLFF